MRSGVYIVPTNRWYIERTVWLIAGVVLLASTAMALLVSPLWILGVTATGLVSINVAFTGFCPVGSVLRLLGFTPMLGVEDTHPLEPVLHANGQMVSGAPHLSGGGNQHFGRVLLIADMQPVVRLCSRSLSEARWYGLPRPVFV